MKQYNILGGVDDLSEEKLKEIKSKIKSDVEKNDDQEKKEETDKNQISIFDQGA